MPKIKIYTTDSCPGCQQAKRYFQDHELDYEEINVTRDPAKQQEMIIISKGNRSVPVIAIEDGSGRPEVIIGYQLDRLQTLLV